MTFREELIDFIMAVESNDSYVLRRYNYLFDNSSKLKALLLGIISCILFVVHVMFFVLYLNLSQARYLCGNVLFFVMFVISLVYLFNSINQKTIKDMVKVMLSKNYHKEELYAIVNNMYSDKYGNAVKIMTLYWGFLDN